MRVGGEVSGVEDVVRKRVLALMGECKRRAGTSAIPTSNLGHQHTPQGQGHHHAKFVS